MAAYCLKILSSLSKNQHNFQETLQTMDFMKYLFTEYSFLDMINLYMNNSGVMDVHFREFWTLCQDVQYSTIEIGGFLNGHNV